MGSIRRAVVGLAAPIISDYCNSTTMATVIVFILVTLLGNISCSCKFRGKKICVGAVTKEFKTSVKICTPSGIIKFKKKSEVPPGYPLAGGECVWYGEVLCDGALVQDLYRWWFHNKCSKGRMSVVSRSWLEVVKDPRYQKGV